MPIRFKFRWIPACATLLLAAAGTMLGQWQTHRAGEKLAIDQRMQTRAKEAPLVALPPDNQVEAVEFRHVLLAGQFLPRWTLYLENRPHDGVPGFHVLMPFKIAGSDRVVMVARGWAPRDAADRTRVPQVTTPAGEVSVDGVLRRDAGHVLQLGQPDAPQPGAILQNLDMDALARVSGLALSSYVIEQRGELGDKLVRDWPLPSMGVERHQAYALQWYALAAMSLVFFVVTGIKRGRDGKS